MGNSSFSYTMGESHPNRSQRWPLSKHSHSCLVPGSWVQAASVDLYPINRAWRKPWAPASGKRLEKTRTYALVPSSSQSFSLRSLGPGEPAATADGSPVHGLLCTRTEASPNHVSCTCKCHGSPGLLHEENLVRDPEAEAPSSGSPGF